METINTPRTDRKLIDMGLAGSTSKFAEHTRQLERELIEANRIADAARNLCKVKGRFHTEQAMKQLMEACGLTTKAIVDDHQT